MPEVTNITSTQIKQIPSTDLRDESEIISLWQGNIDKPLVSIGCITYNHEKYIEDAIVGFLKQKTDFPFEILIHDDASTDRTSDIIRKYETLYPRIIKVMYQSENQYSKGKSPFGFNVARAKSRFFAMCEGDDYWISSKHLQTAMAAFRLNEGISIYGSASFIKKTDSLKLIAFKKVRYDLSTYILDEPFIATCSIVVETSIWKEIADIPVLGGRYFASDKRLKLISLTKGDMIVGSNPSVVYRKGVVGSWSNRAIDKRVVVRELLDNLAITREVGLLSDYSDNELIYRLIEDEVLRKGSQLAGLKGIFSWILFVVFHFRSLSPRNIRAVLSVNPLINHLKNFKNKHTH